jgi:hypothetical protein
MYDHQGKLVEVLSDDELFELPDYTDWKDLEEERVKEEEDELDFLSKRGISLKEITDGGKINE